MSGVWRVYDSPIGPLWLEGDSTGVRSIGFDGGVGDRGEAGGEPPHAERRHIDAMARALDRYFSGESPAFDGAPLCPHGAEFSRLALRAVSDIPPGQTRSYAEVARAMGRPSAVRAVARANATNRLPLVIPCHRVIGSDGSLTGYGGGLERKRWLLDHERRWWGAGLFAAV